MHSQTTDSSVHALISSFTNAFNVFKKLRRKQSKKEERLEDEARLSKSLKRAPADLRSEYERNRALQGERFREGDARAHASLTAVLLRLNNGLVAIITSFLGCGAKDAKLDYRSLTSLSESSRLEALDALSQLSYRLSLSSLSLLQQAQKNDRKSHTRTKSKESESAATVRRVQMSNASESQLAIIKPRAKRREMNRAKSYPQAQEKPKAALPKEQKPPRPPSKDTHKPRRHVSPAAPLPTPPVPNRTPGPVETPEMLWRRRVEKATPSMYTFASDSTKMGEIPMCKWTTPYDYDDMMRKNAEAASRPVTSSTMVEQKPKKKIFKMFRKGSDDRV